MRSQSGHVPQVAGDAFAPRRSEVPAVPRLEEGAQRRAVRFCAPDGEEDADRVGKTRVRCSGSRVGAPAAGPENCGQFWSCELVSHGQVEDFAFVRGKTAEGFVEEDSGIVGGQGGVGGVPVQQVGRWMAVAETQCPVALGTGERIEPGAECVGVPQAGDLFACDEEDVVHRVSGGFSVVERDQTVVVEAVGVGPVRRAQPVPLVLRDRVHDVCVTHGQEPSFTPVVGIVPSLLPFG